MYNQITENKRKTLFLIFIFLVFIIGIAWFADVYLGYGYSLVSTAIVISGGMTLISYFAGDKIALASTGAKEIQAKDNPYIWRMIENLAITSGLPMPRVYIINSPALNAFATGRDPKHASIAVTTGLIQALENEEMEGVLAHELSHIQNYDIRVMTIVVVLVGAIAILSDMFFRARLMGHSDNDNRSSGQLGSILAIFGIVLIVLSPIIAELIKLSISRRREYLADASGALLTRYPEGLARALEKISTSATPLQTASTATAHLFISNPLKGKTISHLFSTHPPIEDRIKKLREMA